MSTRSIPELISAARRSVDSYTISKSDALWVFDEAVKGRSAKEIHFELHERVRYYPSAREVEAICNAAKSQQRVLEAKA